MRIIWLAGVLAVGLCATWALFPVRGQDQPGTPTTLIEPVAQAPPDGPSVGIDKKAFAVQIWNPAPGSEPQPAQSEAKAPQSLKPPPLTLIAIIDEGGARRAALYNANADRILVVKPGDQIDRYTVTAISADAVELSEGESTTRLRLREDHS